jgi:DNA polymerase-3 subunit alpha
MKFLIFDTETTGLPKDRYTPAISRPQNWPDIVSISWMVFENARLITTRSHIVRPVDWVVPKESTAIHGITDSSAIRNGVSLDWVIEAFRNDLHECDVVVAHNLAFDKNVVDSAWYWRCCPIRGLANKPSFGWPPNQICTAEIGKDFCKFPFLDNQNRYRFPKLGELYTFMLKRPVPYVLHSSLFDTLALSEIFFSVDVSTWLFRGSERTITTEGDANGSDSTKGTLRVTISKGNI